MKCATLSPEVGHRERAACEIGGGDATLAHLRGERSRLGGDLDEQRGVRVEAMTTFLDSARDEIAARLRELEPLVAEYRQLEAAAAALAALPGLARRSTTSGSWTAPSSSRGTTRVWAVPSRGRGRPRGGDRRALQAIELVKAEPGITVAELAAAMGIKQNYLGAITTRPVPTQAMQRLEREPMTIAPEKVEAIRSQMLAARRKRDPVPVSVLAYAGLRPGGEALPISWEQIARDLHPPWPHARWPRPPVRRRRGVPPSSGSV